MEERIEREQLKKEDSSMDERNSSKELMSSIASFKNMQQMWNIPSWYNNWSVISGVLQLIICGFYLFVSISLLGLKASAIKMFYFVTGANIYTIF